MEVSGSGRSVVGAVRDAMRRYRDQPLGDLPDPGSPLALLPDGSAAWITEISASDASGLRCPLCGGPLSLTGDGASRRLAHEGACDPEGAARLARAAALDALREAGMAAFAPLTEFRDGEDVPLPVPGEDLACDRSGEVVRVIRFAEARDDGSGAGVVAAAEGGGEVTILVVASAADRGRAAPPRPGLVMEIDLSGQVGNAAARPGRDAASALARGYFWAGAAFREAVVMSAPRRWLDPAPDPASEPATPPADRSGPIPDSEVEAALERARTLVTRTSASDRLDDLEAAALEAERVIEEVAGASAGSADAPHGSAASADQAGEAGRALANRFGDAVDEIVRLEAAMEAALIDDGPTTSLPEAGAENPPEADAEAPPPEAPSAPQPPAPERAETDEKAAPAPWDVPAGVVLNLPPGSDIGPTFPGGALGERLPAEEASDAVKGLFRELGERGNFRHLLRVMGLTPAEAGGFPVWVILRYRGGLQMAIRALDSPDRPSDEAWDAEDARRRAETAPAREPDPAGEVPAEDAPPGLDRARPGSHHAAEDDEGAS